MQNPHFKQLHHNCAYGIIEHDAILTLLRQNSALVVPQTQLVEYETYTLVQSPHGNALDNFFVLHVKTLRDAFIVAEAACKVVHNLHTLGMLHLDCRPDNLVVMNKSDATPTDAVTFTLSTCKDQVYSVHLADFETMWRPSPPENIKMAFEIMSESLKTFNYQSHDWYLTNFAKGVKFDMHAFLIGFSLFLCRAKLDHKFKTLHEKCNLLANMDSNIDHRPRKVYSPVDKEFYYYFLLNYDANVSTAENAASVFAECANEQLQ